MSLLEFSDPRTRARRGDPDTSHKAAAAIMPSRFTIRQQVEQFALDAGTDGFTDEDLCDAFSNRAGSTMRTRRSELGFENIVVDSARRKLNSKGREVIVWVHRDHHPSPPAQIAKADVLTKAEEIATLRARVKELEYAVDQALIVCETDEGFSSTASAMADILQKGLNKGKDEDGKPTT